MAEGTQPTVAGQALQRLALEDAGVRQVVEDPGLEDEEAPLIQCSLRGFSRKPVTRSSPSISVTPNCSSGRTTVIDGERAVGGVELRSAARSTSATPSA